jgi:hypothetical protein
MAPESTLRKNIDIIASVPRWFSVHFGFAQLVSPEQVGGSAIA